MSAPTPNRWSLPALEAARALLASAALAGLGLWAVAVGMTASQNEQAGALAAGSAQVAAQVVDANVMERTADLLMYRRFIEQGQLWREPDRLRARLEDVQASRPGYSWMGLADPQGRVTVGTQHLGEGADVGGRTWFTGGRQDLFHGDVHPARLLADKLPPLPGGEPWRFVDIAAPVRDAQGRLVSVLAAHLSWPWLRERLATAHATSPPGATLWLVGQDGLARVGDGGPAPLQLQSLAQARLGHGGWLLETWPDGRRYVTGYAPHKGSGQFGGFGWVTLVRAPADAWSPAAATQLRLMAGIAVLVVLAVAALAWLSARARLRPLRHFIDEVVRLREGDAAPRLPPRLPAEWQALNQGIARLVERLDHKEHQLRAALAQSQDDLAAARDEAESAGRAKSDFLATMSHELRTPLNAIMGFSRVLEESLEDREQRRQARFVRETAHVLTRILNDVLDLAKVDAGKFSLDPRPFDLTQVLDSCRALYRVVATERGVSFEVDMPARQTPLVGDPIRLRQVLENLLSNAFKFTSSGAVSLRVTVTPLEYAPTRQAMVCIQVLDTGIGMTPEQLTRVFERFEQADRSVKVRFGGAGLGLAIVKTLVEKMGGSIRVHSEQGMGTEFTLAIPFEQGEARQEAAPEPPLSEPERPLRVLVADDLSLNRIVISAQLQARGHTVVEAQDGQEALRKVREERPDLVLMDLDMPELDGLEATRRMRSQELGRRTPVWALTGKTFAEDMAACREAGMDGHLAKPVSLEDLVRVLRSVAPAD